MRPDRLRFASAGFREQRDSGPLRHSRTQAALSRAAAGQSDHLLFLDDRAAGWRRSEGVHHQRAPRWRSLGDQRREVVLVVCVDGVVFDSDGGDGSDASPYQRHSMFVVPAETAGINVLRDVGLGYQPLGGGGREGYVRYENVRVPADHMLGPRGGAFVVAQTRLGGGRIHHAMRTVGLVRRIFDMLCERAVSRHTQGQMLSDKQLVQQMVADSWMEIEAFRLLTLQTAWKIDQHNDYKAVRADISAVKAMMQKVLHDVSARALQLHGSLGTTHEMPFVQHLVESFVLGLADGPTEVHKVT